MGRPRNRLPTPETLRKRAQRERRRAGLRGFWLYVDEEAAWRRFPEAEDGDDLRALIEEFLDDELIGDGQI